MTRAEHGTRSMYITASCRCPECRLAESNYQKARRRIKPKRKPLAAVPSIASINIEPGRVETAVISEIAMLSAASKRPGLVEGALAMARLLDNPLCTPQYASAMRRLQDALAELHQGADAKRGWLADVKGMTS